MTGYLAIAQGDTEVVRDGVVIEHRLAAHSIAARAMADDVDDHSELPEPSPYPARVRISGPWSVTAMVCSK